MNEFLVPAFKMKTREALNINGLLQEIMPHVLFAIFVGMIISIGIGK